jgi:hypothetical protein
MPEQQFAPGQVWERKEKGGWAMRRYTILEKQLSTGGSSLRVEYVISDPRFPRRKWIKASWLKKATLVEEGKNDAS